MPSIGPTSPNAARLRRNATECEQRLWAVLRNRQLEGFKFRRQATVGPFVVDFLCAEYRFIVEIDGGQHDERTDASRTAQLQSAGYVIHRFWNHDVVENFDGVVERIRLELLAVRAG
ncbi:MAG: endonuclease domain-containing protein [Sphingobium yanoikuyae]|uniref:Endonuclease domain-containing protein n=1 Tax=Sphingobium yanoikuyae TaxID=13690 RepID=A0A9X7U7G4_SPHYA|nr:endonuclease domain-containing protein [Sphingobium yanoikuyae]MBO9527496.1 endonuclease domain-containing protein [Sphingobium yanoikuyae]QNG45121.1 endonuclease domain-containing protein [Sphingobium yanoikuyae]